MFSFNKKRIDELLEYIVTMPEEDSSHDRGHKFPFLANQVFTDGGKGVESIVEHFFFSQAEPKVQSPALPKENPFKTCIAPGAKAAETQPEVEEEDMKQDLSDEFEEIQMMVPANDDEVIKAEPIVADGVMENIANLVGMLEEKSDKTEEVKEDLLAKLADPKNTKRSFEMKLDTGDDDDEIFIVHEEDDEQDSLFVDGGITEKTISGDSE